MKNILIYLFLSSILFTSCEKDFEVAGKKPVYYSYEDSTVIRRLDPIEFGDLGKIVTSGNYIFIGEKNKGIHVINNVDPTNPIKEHFWQIPGNREFTVFGNILYAENGKNLWVINIENFAKITVENIIINQYYPRFEERYPSGYSGYFECYYEKNGIFKEWKDAMLVNPLCETL